MKNFQLFYSFVYFFTRWISKSYLVCIKYLMLKAKQSLNLKKTLHIFDKFSCLPMKFTHGHKKTCTATKILANLHFLLFFGFSIKSW